jgi:hypothetical protein
MLLRNAVKHPPMRHIPEGNTFHSIEPWDSSGFTFWATEPSFAFQEEVCSIWWIMGSLTRLLMHAWGTRYCSWLRHYATSRKVAGSIPDEVTGFFYWPNPSTALCPWRSTQPLTEMSTKYLPGVRGRLARMANKLTTICEPIAWKMWKPQHLTTLYSSTACYRDSNLMHAYM